MIDVYIIGPEGNLPIAIQAASRSFIQRKAPSN